MGSARVGAVGPLRTASTITSPPGWGSLRSHGFVCCCTGAGRSPECCPEQTLGAALGARSDGGPACCPSCPLPAPTALLVPLPGSSAQGPRAASPCLGKAVLMGGKPLCPLQSSQPAGVLSELLLFWGKTQEDQCRNPSIPSSRPLCWVLCCRSAGEAATTRRGMRCALLGAAGSSETQKSTWGCPSRGSL